jgi:hypothetical protein
MVRVQINHDSPSGGCTFNYGAKGAKAIKIIDSAGERDPNANELKQNAFCTMTYDADANSSAGAWIATDIVTAALDTSNFALKVEAEGTKPSAATCDIGSVTEYRVNVTGTTAITSFGSGANKRKLLRFTNAVTLTHHATSLILPGGANITTAAGDVFEFVSDASGNWRCVGAQLASGKAIVASDTSALEAKVNEIERVSKNWVQTHFTTAVAYGPGTDIELLGLATTIDNVASGNAVQIELALFHENSLAFVLYVKRNGVEIGSAPQVGSRNTGFMPMPYDNDLSDTPASTHLSFIDETPDTGTNAYTFHLKAPSNTTAYINRTVADTNAAGSERGASCVQLKEMANG